MARITIEDCLENVDNRFTLIHMAAKRVRQLRKGAEETIVSKNKDIVVSLREIAAGTVVKVKETDEDPLLAVEEETLSEELQENATEKIQAEEKGDENRPPEDI